ncbi:MAG TPA: hypothetical protein VK171_02490 [Fimbriimonas sp.]|nr:hypothetical protein [Fimbriimonas sp.]
MQQKTGGTNLGLIAVFALPLLLVTALLQMSKRYVDVFEGGENLDELVKQAKAAGYPFEASELPIQKVPDSNNGYIPLKKYFLDKKNPVPKQSDEQGDFAQLEKKELHPNVAELIRRAKIVAAKTQFDAKRDYEQGWSIDYSDSPAFTKIIKALCFDAGHRARYGDPVGGINSLRLARNVILQLSQDPEHIGVLTSVACQNIYYFAVADMAQRVRHNSASLDELFALVANDFPLQPLESGLKLEFYQGLAMLRNYTPREVFIEGGDFSFSGEKVEYRPKIRTGLPSSTVNQALLAKVIKRYLDYDAVRKSESNGKRAAEIMDQIAENAQLSISERLVGPMSPTYSNLEATRRKPADFRRLCLWAIQIAKDYPNGFPETLPAQPSAVPGGKLMYTKFGDQFAVYSTGADKVDSGGYVQKDGKLNPNRGDDFGFAVPIKPPQTPDPRDI